MMFPYSDKKIIANPPPAYSVLNPETNSDSPSAKSMELGLLQLTLKLSSR
jgi:hypothetical protein